MDRASRSETHEAGEGTVHTRQHSKFAKMIGDIVAYRSNSLPFRHESHHSCGHEELTEVTAEPGTRAACAFSLVQRLWGSSSTEGELLAPSSAAQGPFGVMLGCVICGDRPSQGSVRPIH